MPLRCFLFYGGLIRMLLAVSLDFRIAGLTWLGAHVLGCLLGEAIACYYKLPRSTKVRPLVRWLQRRPCRLAGAYLFGAVWGVGIPYLALISGAITSRDVGLSDLDWITSIGRGSVLLVGAFLLTGFIWWQYAHSIRAFELPLNTSLPLTICPDTRVKPFSLRFRLDALARSWGWSILLWQAFTQEAQWAFYRGAILPWLDAPYGPYLALLLIWGLLCVKYLISRRLYQIDDRLDHLWDAMLAVVSTSTYISTRNFWVCLATHFLLDLGISRFFLQSIFARPLAPSSKP